MIEKDSAVLPQQTPEPLLESNQSAFRTLLRNSTYYLGSDMVIKILSFLFNVYIVRQLGDERFGLYSAALAYAGIFSIIGDLGMTQYVTREIARGRRQADELFWNIVCVRLILSTIAIIVITASAHFVVGYDPSMVLGIFLVCIGFLLHAFWGPIDVILNANMRIDHSSTLSTIIQISFVTVGTLVLVNGYSFHGLILASLLGVPIAALLGIIQIRRLKLATLKLQIDPKIWWPLLMSSLPFALITFTIMAATDLDTVMLSLLRTPEEIGWYKAAYNLTFKLTFIKDALLVTLTPQMSRYYGVSKSRVASTFGTSFKVLWAFSFPVALGTALLAQPLIVWLYTEEYAPSGMVLAILIWSIPLLNLSSLCGSVTTATDKEKKAAKVYLFAALMNLGSNIIAIPIWGYIGAAAATVITEAIALVLFYRVLHSEFPLTDVKNILIKPVVAGLIMGVVILPILDWPLIIVISIGAIVYPLALFALKPFNQAELEIINGAWSTLRRRLKIREAS